jgi:hypothetical protein
MLMVQEEMKALPYPTARDFLNWVRNRMTVTFRRLDQAKVRLRLWPHAAGLCTLLLCNGLESA